jgi:hypothetical protein
LESGSESGSERSEGYFEVHDIVGCGLNGVALEDGVLGVAGAGQSGLEGCGRGVLTIDRTLESKR